MRKAKYRAQILLEPEQHTALAEIAQRQGRSISDVTREIVAQYLVQQEDNLHQRQEVMEQIKQFKARVLARRGGKPIEIDVTKLIEEMRTERSDELFSNIFGSRD
jgi:hypothetical protein